MRNQRSNFIPLPTKPAKSTPKPLPRLGMRKSSSSQTDRVVLVKEEHLNFQPCSRVGHNDGGMRRDYVKAVNYINSCHKFINTVISKNCVDKNNVFLLPMVTNFVPLFPYLCNKKSCRKEKKEPEEIKRTPEKVSSTSTSNKTEDRKSKSNFAVVKEEPAPVVTVPVGDCEECVVQPVQKADENKYASQVADVVKEQIHQFLNTLQGDMKKASKKKLDSPKQKCRNVDLVKQRLQELSKICVLKNEIESNTQIVQFASLPQPPPPPPQNKDTSEDCSVIQSDTDCEDFKSKTKILSREFPQINGRNGSASSLMSDSSDIRSDSDVEINIAP